jgi:2-polyprenyl-3-methyl-5-hydroxy-6-metoxy-1,4-benzoquinol methylase
MDRRIEWILSSFNYRQDRLEAELRHATEALGEALLDRRLARLAAAEELVVPVDTARFLNWAEGPDGPAARGGLWFNSPVPAEYAQDAVNVLLVNERIVEQPYLFGALHSLRPGARILDVGGSESTVALSLASLGYHVSVVDPRGYRLEHPLLDCHAVPLERLRSDLRFDAAVALSSLEHFGLGGYRQPQLNDVRMDRTALADIHRRLADGGLLVLTVPCSPASAQDDFQRIYSFDELREMLAGWSMIDLSVAWRTDLRTWVRGAPDEPQCDSGVALVTARKGRT